MSSLEPPDGDDTLDNDNLRLELQRRLDAEQAALIDESLFLPQIPNDEELDNFGKILGLDDTDSTEPEEETPPDPHTPRLEEALRAVSRGEPSIDLARAHLTRLDPEVLFHPNIDTLDLYENQLTTLPSELGELELLTRLDVSSNMLDVLPEFLGNLSRLEILNVSNNSARKFPQTLSNLQGLRFLRASDNRIKELDVSIMSLSALEELEVEGNEIRDLPTQISRLRQLRVLGLSRNRIRVLPSEVGRLINLRILSVDNNDLRSVVPEIRKLSVLEDLDLSNNQIEELPDEIGLLRKLQVLHLGGNRLTSLPVSIGKLKNLKELHLDHNLITRLPKELGYLDETIYLDLEGNPLEEQYDLLLERGNAALFSYLRSLENSTPRYEAKLLLVGEGGVGKSSLIAALRSEKFVENRPTTHGIEIDTLKVGHPKIDEDISLNTWDFGGQEVYRISHQFFFSQRALYLVVWKPREGQEENNIESWCRRIRLRVGDQAKVIIVATHADERRPEFDFRLLRSKFPHIVVGYFAVDSESGRGLNELRKAIAEQAAQLPQMGELLSNRWIEARRDLLANKTAYISRAAFERQCASRGLSEQEAATLGSLLHDLGHIVHYSNDEGLRDLVVLRPEWLTKAIGYVLEDENTRSRAGILPHRELVRIWADSSTSHAYPIEYHPYFLRLMEKFDVSYRLPGEHASLVAQLVPYWRPRRVWETSVAPIPNRRGVLRAICRTAEEAPGLISWLTVRNHRFSTGVHWRRGVVLRHEAYRCDAVFELMVNNKDLRLTVSGPAPDFFFHVLKDGIEELIARRWKGLPYTFLVPCSKQTEDGRRCSGLITFKSLLLFRQRQEPRIICSTCANWSDVSALLTGFGNEASSLDVALQRIQQVQRAAASQLTRIEVTAAETARQVRSVGKMLSAEVTDCPRLFTLIPTNRSRALRTISPRQHLRITLWCEELGQEHPCTDASYEFRPTKEWVNTVGPYVRFVASLLRLLVPVGGAVYATILSEDELKEVRSEIDLTKVLADKFPRVETEKSDIQHGMTKAEGAGLRALRALLLKLDPANRFGDLRRAGTASGDLIWVCPRHYRLYDPGLPNLSPLAGGQSKNLGGKLQ